MFQTYENLPLTAPGDIIYNFNSSLNHDDQITTTIVTTTVRRNTWQQIIDGLLNHCAYINQKVSMLG